MQRPEARLWVWFIWLSARFSRVRKRAEARNGRKVFILVMASEKRWAAAGDQHI